MFRTQCRSKAIQKSTIFSFVLQTKIIIICLRLYVNAQTIVTMREKSVTVLLLMFCLGSLRAQEMLGTWGSNYGGVSSAIQNPAFIANSKLYMDINLVGAGFSYYHNDAYLEESDSYLYHYLHTKIGFPKQTAKTNYYANHRPEFVKANMSARELGPAVMWNSGKNAFALSFSMREFMSLSDFPNALASLTKYGSINQEIIDHGGYNVTQPIRAAGMAWSETAFTYARVLKSDNQNVVTLGATVKYLVGYAGGYVNVKNIDFTATSNTTISITDSYLNTGMSLPYDYSATRDNLGLDKQFKTGKGFGTDLGFSIQHNVRQHYVQRFNRLCEQEFEQYDYRFAVSLLDIGYIKFKDHVASETYANTIAKPIDYDLRDFSFNSTQAAINRLNSLYGVTPNTTDPKFSVLLPSAISFQYDKWIKNNIYVTAGGIIGMPLGKSALQRPSQLALIPRYESDIFEVSIPLSLYDFKNPRLGLSTRIYFLTLGTDRLISLGGVHDYYGYDFYASIRLNFMKFFRMQYIKGQCPESSNPCF